MGKRIRDFRCSQGKSQEIFADDNYISTSYLALIETGKRTASIDVLLRIANNCHCSLDYLILGKKDDGETSLNQQIVEICKGYPEDRIRRGLSLLEYYLKLEDS